MHIDEIIAVRAEEISRFIAGRNLNLPPKQFNRIIRKATENLIKIKRQRLSRPTNPS